MIKTNKIKSKPNFVFCVNLQMFKLYICTNAGLEFQPEVRVLYVSFIRQTAEVDVLQTSVCHVRKSSCLREKTESPLL